MLEPEPNHNDVLRMADHAEALGYKLLLRDAGYTLEEIKATLRETGPSAFLSLVRVQEDIAPQAPERTTEEFLAERLARLAPESELVIVDPYLFTKVRRNDADVYAASVARLVSPLLGGEVGLTVVINGSQSHRDVEDAVREALTANHPSLHMQVVDSEDFHDRFWIADRARGIIMGSSLNKIGGKIFFIDSLNDEDVAAVVAELGNRGLWPS